jgi:hypothetical protein
MTTTPHGRRFEKTVMFAMALVGKSDRVEAGGRTSYRFRRRPEDAAFGADGTEDPGTAAENSGQPLPDDAVPPPAKHDGA